MKIKLEDYLEKEIELNYELGKNKDPVGRAFFAGQALALNKLWKSLHAGEIEIK